MLLVYLLSTITLVFVLVCLLDQKKSDPQPPQPQPLQPWTGDELSLFLKMLKSKGGTQPDDVLECIVSNLSRSISYKDLMSKSEDQKNLIKKAGNICLLGVKGKWTALFKKEILNILMKKMNGGCALCMLETAEQNYDPTQINENNLPQIITSFMIHCKDYCTH